MDARENTLGEQAQQASFVYRLHTSEHRPQPTVPSNAKTGRKGRNMSNLSCSVAQPKSMPPSMAGISNSEADFASIYRTYRRRILSQCFCMLRNHGDAEDAA